MNRNPRKHSSNSKADRNNTDRLRQELANETAKIIALEGVRDYQRAKNKACERLGNSQHGSLPSNLEIEQAMSLYQQTFIPEHDEIIQAQRYAALEVMKWFEAYTPYLSGCVLEGTVSVNSIIHLHVSAETIEALLVELQAKKIPTEIRQRRLKLNNEFEFLPAICFEFQDYEFEVIVFSLRQQYQKPKSKSRNGSMQRISLKKLELMLTEN